LKPIKSEEVEEVIKDEPVSIEKEKEMEELKSQILLLNEMCQ
jgi:hypothetical protein